MVADGLLDALLIEGSPAEVRAAGVDDEGRLVVFALERAHAPSRVDELVLGRVTKVDNRLGAFVDIGPGEPGLLPRAQGLQEGTRIVAGVTRDAVPGKGPGLTQTPSLPGRYVVFHPFRAGIASARSLGQGRTAAMLGDALAGLPGEGAGATVRAAAAAVDAAVVAAELRRLRADWKAVLAAAESVSPPATLRAAPDAVMRILRDEAPARAVAVDDRAVFHRLQRTLRATMPDRASALAYHDSAEPLFESAGVADAVEALADRRVPLPGGGRLTIDRTEALTAIDVDLGRSGGRFTSERAALQANLSAAPEVARQVRLRRISGLIVVDAVSLRGRDARARVLQAFRQAFRDDEVTTDVLGITPAGLVEITRRRSGPPLDERLLLPAAAVPHPEAIAAEALRRLLRLRGAGEPVLRAAPAVLAALEGPMAAALAETGRRLGRMPRLVAEPASTAPEVRMER